jgi:lysozyme
MRPIPPLAIDFVARWEGCRLAAYRDVAGVLTIGYGHTGADVTEGQTIARTRARALLTADLETAAARLVERVGETVVEALTPSQYAALLSFVFNLGANPKWTLWKVLKARRFDEVPPQLMRFVNASGRVVQGLVNRRAAECALWHEAAGEPATATPPSSVTRVAPTPPTPADSKPLAASKSFTTAAATGVTAAAVAVGEVSKAVSPYAAQSEMVSRCVSVLALVAAALAVAALVFAWLKRRGGRV